MFKRNQEFARNISMLVGGAALGRVIAILVAPIVARLYSPDDFGVAALFLATAVVLNSVSSLRYENAIVLPEAWESARILIKLAAIILFGFCLVLLLFFGFVFAVGWQVPGLENIGAWIVAVPFAVLLLGAGNILRQWAIREKRFKVIAHSEVGDSAVTAGSRILLGTLFGSSVYGLILGYFSGTIARLGILLRGKKGHVYSHSTNIARSEELSGIASRYRNFPIYNAPTGLLNAVSDQLVVLFLGAIYAPAVVGYYAMGNRLVRMPMGTVGKSVQQVFLQKAAEMHRRGGKLGPALMKTTMGLVLLGSPVFILLYMYGMPLFEFVLGDRWGMAGRYAEILAPLLLVLFILAPSTAIFVVLERQRLYLFFQIVRVVVVGGVFLISVLWNMPAINALELYSGTGVLVNLGIILAAFLLAQKHNVGTPA
jgi:O-antigen/teichoic acid export membrane protein